MMNRSVMGRQMFAKGGAAFPDLSGDGKVTQKDILMGRGVVPMAEGGEVPGDVRAIFQGLVESMRGSKEDVAAYVRGNTQDLSDIAKMYPNMAAMINEGFKVTSEVPMQEYFPPGYGESPESLPPMQPEGFTERDMGRFKEDYDSYRENEAGDQMLIPRPPPGVMEEMPEAPPFTRLQMGGEPMAAAMEQGAMPAEPMAAMGALSPADLGSMDTAGIASQMDPEVVAIMQGAANNFGDPEQAESLEGMMDAVRGTRATEEERREELAGVVGPEDAAATPDSVLAMVQPLMLLMGAQGAVETEVDTGGIGPMAQDTMNVPVSGDMAGGIMQMAAPPPPEGGVPPVNFSQGGEVLRFKNAGAVPFNMPKVPTVPTFGGKPSASLTASSSSTVPSQMPSLTGGKAAALNTTLAGELKARQDIYNELLGRDEEAVQDSRMLQFYSDLAKAGSAFAQAPKPGQSALSQLSESLTGADILGNQAKISAQEASGKQARNLAALSAAEKALTAEKEFVFKSKLSAQTAASEAAQSFRDISQKFKNQMKITETKADRDARLAQIKARFDNFNAAQEASRQFLTDVEKKNLDNKIAKDFAVYQDTINDANREDEKANRLDEMGLKHTYNVFGMQAQTVEDLKKMRETQKFDEKTQKSAFAQQDKLQAAKAKTQTLLQEKRLEAQALQNKIVNAQTDEKIALQERATKVNEDLALIKGQAAKLDALSKEVALYKNPDAALPALLNQKVQVQGQNMTKIQAFGKGKLDELQDNRVKSMLAEVYRGKSVYNPSTGDTVIQQTGYLSPEIEDAILERERARGDIDNYVVATINARREADFYKTASPDDKRKRLERALADRTSLSVLERYKAGENQSPQEKAKIGDAIYSAIGTEGFLGQAANYISAPTAGYTFSKEVASGGAIAQALSNSALRAFLDMTPGRDNVQIQERFAKLIPGVKNPFTNATMYKDRINALVAGLRTSRDAAVDQITSGKISKPADIAEMTKGLRLATALINDYTYISDYIDLKQAN